MVNVTGAKRRIMAAGCTAQSTMSNNLYRYISSIHYTKHITFQNQYTKGKQHIVNIAHINITSFSVGCFEILPVKRKFATRSLYNECLMAYVVFWIPYSEDRL